MTVQIGRPSAHVAEVIMNRPEAMNALSTDQVRRLGEAASQLAADDQVSVVIISSALEKAFCVGADLKERRGFDNDDLRRQRPVFQKAFGALRELPVPVIAAVEGFALGGGCELALSGDLIIASASATFGLPEVGIGLIPGEGGTQLLPRRIGLNRAADLLLTGRRVDAEEALRMGLADRLVPEGVARTSALAACRGDRHQVPDQPACRQACAPAGPRRRPDPRPGDREPGLGRGRILSRPCGGHRGF